MSSLGVNYYTPGPLGFRVTQTTQTTQSAQMMPHLITPEQRVPQARQALTDTRSFSNVAASQKIGSPGDKYILGPTGVT